MTATDRKAFSSVLKARDRAQATAESEMREYASLLSMKHKMNLLGFHVPWLMDDVRFKQLEAKYGVKDES